MQKMMAAFEPYGVTKEHIEKRIQRRLDAITPAQVVSLKRIYASLRDDMSTPAEWFDMGEDAAACGTRREALTPCAQPLPRRRQAARSRPPPKASTKTAADFIREIDNATGEEPPPCAGRGEGRTSRRRVRAKGARRLRMAWRK